MIAVEKATCLNCGEALSGQFCSQCAQSATVHRFNLRHFIHEFAHALTHSDKGLFSLAWNLLIRPGVVIREYLAGKRKKYFNPATFLVVMIAFQLFVTKKLHYYERFSETAAAVMKRSFEIAPDKIDDVDNSINQATTDIIRMNDNSKLINIVMIPVLSLLTWLMFFKSGFNYAENLVINCFIVAKSYVLFLLLGIIPFLIAPGTMLLFFLIYTLTSIGYFIFAYRKVFQRNLFITILKGIVIQIVYGMAVQVVYQTVVPYL